MGRGTAGDGALLPPAEALARGRDPESGLGLTTVEWREDELEALLARRFAGGRWDIVNTSENRAGSTSWIAFALARGEVARALNYSEDAAAEWLRQAALNGRIRVRYSTRYQQTQISNLNLNGHPSNLAPEQRAAEQRCWFTPIDDMELGPSAMTGHPIMSFSQWDAASLSAALAAEAASAMAHSSVEANSKKGSGGRPAATAWWRAMVEVGAWLRDNGEPDTLAAVERYLAERLEHHGRSGADSHVRERARLALETFKDWKAGN